MPDDLPLFLASVALLILYLVFSALTEMRIKLPRKIRQLAIAKVQAALSL
jgi:hypothetical protein